MIQNGQDTVVIIRSGYSKTRARKFHAQHVYPEKSDMQANRHKFALVNYVVDHPIKDSYLNNTYDWHPSNGESYDMRSWDITSVVAAIEHDVIPRVLGPGRITVSSTSQTSFNGGSGSHHVLAESAQLSSTQQRQLIDLMIQLVSAPPQTHPSRSLTVSIPQNPFQ